MSANTFIMKPKVDFCFKGLMGYKEVRLGLCAALLKVKPEASDGAFTVDEIPECREEGGIRDDSQRR